ncbi:hypothetical protein [Nonomuraea jiangxiensis]|uniref:hypothetical protein n=1 Tax=Nonomuraea jiangxiensis TaxID=633440 RepID=UPI000B891769|nr:hypothetical protein [Nonomuraea jiangxiensis]
MRHQSDGGVALTQQRQDLAGASVGGLGTLDSPRADASAALLASCRAVARVSATSPPARRQV